MKKIIISFLAFTLLSIGTVLATQISSAEQQQIRIGIIDIQKIAAESSSSKKIQNRLGEKGREFIRQLEEDKANLSEDEYTEKRKAYLAEYMKYKSDDEKELDQFIRQAVAKVAKGKNLPIVFYKNGTFDGTDITDDVINALDSSDGTVLSAPKAAIEMPCEVGIVDINRVVKESVKFQGLQNQLNEKGKTLSDQLEADKANLSAEDFQREQQAAYDEFMKFKQDTESQFDTIVKQTLEKVAVNKNLSTVVYKNSVAYGGTDITSDVINSLDSQSN